MDLNLEDLISRKEFLKVIPKARKEILRVKDSTSSSSKLLCLKRCIYLLTGKGGSGNELPFTVTSEDLLPALIYVIAKSSLPNWYTQFRYISDLRLSLWLSDR